MFEVAQAGQAEIGVQGRGQPAVQATGQTPVIDAAVLAAVALDAVVEKRDGSLVEDAELERLNSDMARELASSIVYRVRAVWLTHQKTAL